ncbi:NAD-dependent epimerase/dehydratase family protein [Parasediminibacterium paludis]|uniref:NAD-dependent epimerase/dehydratase family protein n=1 Tax=Parasediminibacterium paludis TaxID=908966 RepID=A0ABV8PZZ1_9BACT
MNICIIGGSGFIGTYLMELLSKNNIVYNLDKAADSNNINHIKVDVTNHAALVAAFPEAIDIVILLAAEHKDNVSPNSLYYDVNVEGTRNVLRVMDEKRVSKILFTSSVAVYGLNKVNPNEESPTNPFNDYGKSKLMAEEVLRSWYKSDANNTLIIIRPTVVFGPGNKGNVYNLLTQIVRGKFIMIGNGNNIKSMAYVENIVSFIITCISSLNNGYYLFNYADKPDISTRQLVQKVEELMDKQIIPIKVPYWIGYAGGVFLDIIGKISGKKFSISAVRIKKFCATTQFSSITANTLNFNPSFTLFDGLSKTVSSIQSELNN